MEVIISLINFLINKNVIRISNNKFLFYNTSVSKSLEMFLWKLCQIKVCAFFERLVFGFRSYDGFIIKVCRGFDLIMRDADN
jgi:hypothetical protein